VSATRSAIAGEGFVSAADPRVIEHAEGFSCALPGGVRVLFGSRAHGNLSTDSGERREHGRAARDRLCEDLALEWLCASRQAHGTSVQRVLSPGGSKGEAVPIDADGHATALAGIGATVLTGDCLPVALGAEASGDRNGVVAVLHAGWRGLAGGVLEEGVDAMRELGAIGPIEAVIGPGAGICCYEVGEEVHAAFGERATGDRYRDGRNIDLRAIARDRLLDASVAHVHDARACTICDQRFFSHRREGDRAGRQAGVAWLA
jgi:purine-nucleoside/S-methyl-5'-thioadenosine phosphorylase / adenosine deaminase